MSVGVASALDGYTAGNVTRIAGTDRYATAAAISASAFPAVRSVVYVATGSGLPDALAAGAAAARVRRPVLLVGPNSVPAPTASELTRLAPHRVWSWAGRAWSATPSCTS